MKTRIVRLESLSELRPRIRIVITERDVEAGAPQALRVFADRIARGGKGAT